MWHGGHVRVLVVDDDRRLACAVKRGLDGEGFAVDVAFSGTDGLWHAREATYDVIVLDVMLPGLDGLELCARLREAGEWAPILILTAKGGERDEVHALDTGADDFLAKPLSYVVLVARLRAFLRRGRVERPATLQTGDPTLDPSTHQVWRGDVGVHLTPRQFSLLELLMRRAGEVLSSSRFSARSGTSRSTVTPTSSRSTSASSVGASTSRSGARPCRPCGVSATGSTLTVAAGEESPQPAALLGADADDGGRHAGRRSSVGRDFCAVAADS